MKQFSMKRSRYASILALLPYLRKQKRTFLLSILYGVLNNVLLLGSLLLSAHLTGMAFSKAPAREIGALLLPLFLLIAGRGAFQYLNMVATHDVAYLVLEELRRDAFDAVERGTPVAGLRYRTGDLSSIVMEDVETLEVFLAHILGDYLVAAISMAINLALCAYLSPGIAALSAAAAVLVLLIPYLFGPISSRTGRQLRKRIGESGALVLDMIQGMKEILLFGRRESATERIVEATESINGLALKDGAVKGLQAALITLAGSIVFIAVLALSRSMAAAGTLTPESLSVLIILSMNILMPISAVSGTAGQLNLVAASADRVMLLLSQPSPVQTTPDPRFLTEPDPEAPQLELRGVRFAYEPNAPVLRGVSCQIRSGEFVAITGESGAGKTTLASLLLRFYDPDSGEIRFQGVDFRGMTPDRVRSRIAYVPQDTVLFHGTILENLRLARPEATLEEVRAACRTAVADGFISDMPDGYDSFVGERGVTLSGGQKQRIAIARALLTGAPILLLDEAVSNLDSESEEAFLKALENASARRTVISIAHRHSTLLAADRLLVLAEGAFVYDGDPSYYLLKD